MGTGYYGTRPRTWREWHNAEWYVSRLIVNEED